MLLWLFIAALIMPYIVTWFRGGFPPLTRFSLSQAELAAWINEVDRTSQLVWGGSSCSGRSDSEVSDRDYVFTLKNATPEVVFSHLPNRCLERIKKEGWRITESRTAGESFSLVFSNGFSRYRLYVWNVPLTQDERDRTDERGEQAIRIKVITIGYTSR